MHFMDDSFMNLVEYKAGYAMKATSKKKKRVNSDFAMTIWRFWISDCKYVLLLVLSICYWLFKWVLRVTRRVQGEQGHITAECTARQKSS